MKRINNVIKFGNGLVLVFDENGNQMPKYQGIYSEVEEKINKAVDDKVVFEYADDLASQRTKITKF